MDTVENIEGACCCYLRFSSENQNFFPLDFWSDLRAEVMRKIQQQNALLVVFT